MKKLNGYMWVILTIIVTIISAFAWYQTGFTIFAFFTGYSSAGILYEIYRVAAKNLIEAQQSYIDTLTKK